MRTFQQISALRTYLRGVRAEGRNENRNVGFVPTMGALHEGHLTLMRRAKSECDIVVASIFVNPTQFGPKEDFSAYPRDLNRDLQLVSNEGVDAIFAPDTSDMYPEGFQTVVDVPNIAASLEGAIRPGHFRGVATVVTKLLNIVGADRAYFGQKDYQQFLVIERLARDLNVPTAIVMVPTVREADGLALSSRNAYLNPEERRAATILNRALQCAEALVESGEPDPAHIQQEIETLIASEPLAQMDYVAIVHPDTLQPLESLADSPALVALAVRIGKTRLIDNALIAAPGVPLPRSRTGKL